MDMYMKMAGIFFILILLQMEYFFFWKYRKAIRKGHTYIKKTKGVVVSAQRVIFSAPDQDDRYDYSFMVKYRVGDVDYTVQERASFAAVGQKWTVYYNPSNPQECEIGIHPSVLVWTIRIAASLFAIVILLVIKYVLMS